MKKLIFTLSLIFSIQAVSKEVPTKPVSLNAPVNASTHAELYKNLARDLDRIGDEPIQNDGINPESILIQRVTTLLSYGMNKAGDQPVIIPEGVFLMLAPRKENKTKFDLETYLMTDKLLNSVYKYHKFDRDEWGSSFLYKNYIVTNYHMCRGLNTLMRDYQNNIYGVKVLAWNDRQDICILKAPEGVKNQRNFATFKAKNDIVEDEKTSLKTQIEIERIKSKSFLTDRDATRIKSLQNSLTSSKKNYGTVYSIWGEFKVNKFEKDTTIDKWTKANGFSGVGKTCKPGISGGVVASPEGVLGYAWGSEHREEEVNKRNPSSNDKEESNLTCYFVNISEVDQLINKYETEQKK